MWCSLLLLLCHIEENHTQCSGQQNARRGVSKQFQNLFRKRIIKRRERDERRIEEKSNKVHNEFHVSARHPIYRDIELKFDLRDLKTQAAENGTKKWRTKKTFQRYENTHHHTHTYTHSHTKKKQGFSPPETIQETEQSNGGILDGDFGVVGRTGVFESVRNWISEIKMWDRRSCNVLDHDERIKTNQYARCEEMVLRVVLGGGTGDRGSSEIVSS